MKYKCLVLLLLFCFSCQQNILVVAQNVEPLALNYYLAFDITAIDYQNPDGQETHSIYSNQDLGVSLLFEDISESDRYFYFASYRDTAEDSITLIGTLRFVLDNSTPFEQEVFHLEFIINEAREHLNQQAEGGYVYNNNQLLAERLRDLDWGRDNALFSNSPLSEFLLSFPDTSLAEGEVDNWPLTSNGFYFEHENLTFSEVEYRPAADEIVLSGQFNVEMKMLSCGFYSYFSIENANFKALIQ